MTKYLVALCLVLLMSCRAAKKLGAAENEVAHLQHQVQGAIVYPDSVVRIPGKIFLQVDTLQDPGITTRILEKRYYKTDSMIRILNNPVLVEQLVKKTAEVERSQALSEAARDQVKLFERIGLGLLITVAVLLLLIGVMFRWSFVKVP